MNCEHLTFSAKYKSHVVFVWRAKIVVSFEPRPVDAKYKVFAAIQVELSPLPYENHVRFSRRAERLVPESVMKSERNQLCYKTTILY